MNDMTSTTETTEVNEGKLFEAYIQKPEKMAYYQQGLAKMTQAGVLGFKWHWSWWAFFFGWAFLLYRKAYLPAVGAFFAAILSSFIPFVGPLIAAIAIGGSSSYFVIKRYTDLKNTLMGTEQEKINAMYSFGGFHSWVIWVAAIVYGLIIISTIAMFAFIGGAASSGYYY
ncbi:DUF2628 domain-containing protein [Marinospirillum sp. MEB164]|uniref:DUF2628 domain-containing protein n=1 Tax=Marinospirillum alkalitolerans TaxID=3123374 RepID=A0ABW8PVU6_9GAMM